MTVGKKTRFSPSEDPESISREGGRGGINQEGKKPYGQGPAKKKGGP